MANRRPQQQSGRRMDYNSRIERTNKNFGRSGVSPWQGAGPGGGLPNLLPLAGGSTEATLALASNIINLLQPRQNPVPSLLDMPIRRDFGPNMGRYDRGYVPNRMGNQGNFRRTGNYNRAGERINTTRKPFRPNDGQRQQNKSSPKKDADSKAKPVKESDQEEKPDQDATEGEKEEDTKKEPPKTRYDEINPQLLQCHICNKSMWDGRSFENHLSGRAHSIMMQKTAESYALTADTMRQEFKIREMKRTRKTGQQPARDFYCAMCDMYAADGAIHRTTVGHRKLKKYLHPTCTTCHKEMPTRIELDEHRLSAEHLKNMQDKQETIAKPKPEGGKNSRAVRPTKGQNNLKRRAPDDAMMVISTLTMEQSYLRDDRQRWRRAGDHHHEDKEKKQEEAKEGENQTDVEIKQEAEDTEEGNKEGTEQVKQEESLDNENTVLDYKEGDDLSNITPEMYPAYSTERGIGASFLSEFRCVQCSLCRKLLDSEATAAVHLRTWRHHQLFLRLLAAKRAGGEKQEEKQEAEQEATQEENQEESESGKRAASSAPDDGNWKRRKTVPDHQEDDDEPHRNGLAADDVKEEPAEAEAEADAVAEMPPADELEDWGRAGDGWDEDKQDDPPAQPPPAPEAEAAPARAPPRARGSPRGRARARGRPRGRY